MDLEFKWIFLSHFKNWVRKSQTLDPFSVYFSSTRHKLFPEVLYDQTMTHGHVVSQFLLYTHENKEMDWMWNALANSISLCLIRGECLSLSPCSVACLTTPGLLFSWTLQTLYRPLLIDAGGATRNSAERRCSSWLGNLDTQDLNEQQQLLSYVNLRFC